MTYPSEIMPWVQRYASPCACGSPVDYASGLGSRGRHVARRWRGSDLLAFGRARLNLGTRGIGGAATRTAVVSGPLRTNSAASVEPSAFGTGEQVSSRGGEAEGRQPAGRQGNDPGSGLLYPRLGSRPLSYIPWFLEGGNSFYSP